MMSAPRIAALLSLAALFAAAPAGADPVVGPGGVPGVATAWRSADGATRLTIDGDFDPNAVAEAIRAGVPGAKVRVDGAAVTVRGVAQAELLTALEGIEVDSSVDDVDAMLSALQNPGGDDGSGSSIRAGKRVTFDAVSGPPGPIVFGEVTKVKRGKYPLVLISVKLSKSPEAEQGPKRGSTIRVLPFVKAKNGVVDSTHAQSQLNVGAWYAQRGDQVRLRLETEARKGIWVAKAFERVE
jgi:hypothetical protein